ncbi:MAG: DUF1499 domain-containing protein [Kastovskya adunca ATA6-11-RM4]|jgi:uncharacterized protein (DUF1499 family)|nr:DUF1499 domain-containing protein [Kastovskya adunca ATA6-11-RM4]
MFKFSGKKPDNLGVRDRQLAPCPNTPNCVSSQSPITDKEHSIEALSYNSTPAEAMSQLKTTLQSMERVNIISETEDYLYTEFTTALMGFVDDVEFLIDDSAKVIHVRSASRLGKSDLGVNRQRVESIRAKFNSL